MDAREPLIEELMEELIYRRRVYRRLPEDWMKVNDLVRGKRPRRTSWVEWHNRANPPPPRRFISSATEVIDLTRTEDDTACDKEKEEPTTINPGMKKESQGGAMETERQATGQ